METVRGEELRIFQAANAEFEDSEEEGENLAPPEDALLQQKERGPMEGDATPPCPPSTVMEQVPCEDLPGPHTSGPSSAAVDLAVKDMKRFMEEHGLGLEDVTQAFLKNSGDGAAVARCLRMGQRWDSCPLWNRQDDMDLLKGDKDLRSRLLAKYGAENVAKREAFRKS